MPGFLHTSNRLELLADHLAALIRTEPLGDPLAAEWIVVPTPGLERWLRFRLAEQNGIAFNLRTLFPVRWFDDLLVATAEPGNRGFPHQPELAIRLFHLLAALRGDPAFAGLEAYLAPGADLHRFQLAWRIAGLFTQYRIYRPDLLAAWAGGRDPGDWQAALWRRLRNDFGPDADLAGRLQALQSRPPPPALPGRLTFFGLSQLAPLHLELCRWLAAHRQVHLFIPQPSGDYWTDILAGRRGRLARIQQQDTDSWDAPFLGNPLAAALAGPLPEFVNRILDADFHPDLEAFPDPEATGILGALQADILAMRDRTEPGKAPAPLPRPGEQTGPAGESLVVADCHGPRRELEDLQEHLLHCFETMPGLRPRDILVLTPDMETYAPYITAVFGNPEEPGRAIPFALADRQERSASPVVAAFLRILRLPGSRCTSRDLMDLLELPALRDRFAFSDNDLDIIRNWIRETRIRWGRDADHHAESGGPPFPENSWAHGLRQLLLGFAFLADQPRLYGHDQPLAGFPAGHAALLDRFLRAVETLLDWSQAGATARPWRDWSRHLARLRTDLFREDDDNRRDLRFLDGLIDQVGGAGPVDREEPVPLTVVRYLVEAGAGETRVAGQFLNGQVTFAALTPMRAVPARVICLVGMGDGAFPRRVPPVSFDRIAAEPRPGDRDPRASDRLLFLETLLAAREHLYISYPGRGVADDNALPPSVVVRELLDYLDLGSRRPEAATGTESGTAWTDAIRQGRRQAFHPDRFRGEPVERSFSGIQAAGARALATATRSPRAYRLGPEPAAYPGLGNPPHASDDRPTDLDLDDLLTFFRHPPGAWLEARTGARFSREAPPLETVEPMAADALEAYQLRALATEAQQAGQPFDALLVSLRARGLLPVGDKGWLDLRSAWDAGTALIRRMRAWTGEAPPEMAEATLRLPDPAGGDDRSLHLRWQQYPGAVPRIADGRLSRRSGRDVLAAWIQQTALHAWADQTGQPVAPELALFRRENTTRLRPPKDPMATLVELVFGGWLPGLHTPLLLFPATSWAYAEARGAGKNPAGACKSAARAWYPNPKDPSPAEAEDPVIRAVFPDFAPDAGPWQEPFIEQAERLLVPAADHLETEAVP
ncbi:MAG: exodeoxyribonuclease V subunit gamma [Opitutales bacterium]